MPTWPSGLNSYAEREGFSFSPGEPQLRTDFETGPARVRQRFTRSVPTVEYIMVMDELEFQLFKGFHYHETNQGASWFTMPVWTGAQYETREVRFREVYTANVFGLNWMRVSLTLEIRDMIAYNGAAIHVISTYGESFLESSLYLDIDRIVNTVLPNAVGTI